MRLAFAIVVSVIAHTAILLFWANPGEPVQLRAKRGRISIELVATAALKATVARRTPPGRPQPIKPAVEETRPTPKKQTSSAKPVAPQTVTPKPKLPVKSRNPVPRAKKPSPEPKTIESRRQPKPLEKQVDRTQPKVITKKQPLPSDKKASRPRPIAKPPEPKPVKPKPPQKSLQPRQAPKEIRPSPKPKPPRIEPKTQPPLQKRLPPRRPKAQPKRPQPKSKIQPAPKGSKSSAPQPKSTPSSRQPRGVIVPPSLLQDGAIELRYPEEARLRNIEGSVVLRLSISATGRVAHAEVIESSGHAILDTAAVRSAYRLRYSPATRGGVPIPYVKTERFNYRLIDH